MSGGDVCKEGNRLTGAVMADVGQAAFVDGFLSDAVSEGGGR
jgi:hypothetical protein